MKFSPPRLTIMSTVRSGICIAILTIAPSAAEAQKSEFVRKEVEWTKSINLRDFGGPHIEVRVQNREITFITAQTADFTKMVPINKKYYAGWTVSPAGQVIDHYGSSGTSMQPTRTVHRVNKVNGVSMPGTRSEMFLLFQEPRSNIKVYFLDAISSLNHDSIVIEVPRRAVSSTTPGMVLPNLLPSQPLERKKKSDGAPISPELLAWYVSLQSQREALDTSDPKAVARFNERVAAYHQALTMARAVQDSE